MRGSWRYILVLLAVSVVTMGGTAQFGRMGRYDYKVDEKDGVQTRRRLYFAFEDATPSESNPKRAARDPYFSVTSFLKSDLEEAKRQIDERYAQADAETKRKAMIDAIMRLPQAPVDCREQVEEMVDTLVHHSAEVKIYRYPFTPEPKKPGELTGTFLRYKRLDDYVRLNDSDAEMKRASAFKLVRVVKTPGQKPSFSCKGDWVSGDVEKSIDPVTGRKRVALSQAKHWAACAELTISLPEPRHKGTIFDDPICTNEIAEAEDIERLDYDTCRLRTLAKDCGLESIQKAFELPAHPNREPEALSDDEKSMKPGLEEFLVKLEAGAPDHLIAKKKPAPKSEAEGDETPSSDDSGVQAEPPAFDWHEIYKKPAGAESVN